MELHGKGEPIKRMNVWADGKLGSLNRGAATERENCGFKGMGQIMKQQLMEHSAQSGAKTGQAPACLWGTQRTENLGARHEWLRAYSLSRSDRKRRPSLGPISLYRFCRAPRAPS